MAFESIIFDVDGTLWDSRALLAEAYNAQLAEEGITGLHVTAQILKPLFGKPMNELADGLFGAIVPAPERYALMDRCMATENDYLHENPCEIGYPGVRETMKQLVKEHRLFIVSNSQCGYPELCIEKLGLGEYISGHLCFGDTGTEKGETIRRLMQQHNIESAVYVGDTIGDMEAAEKAGIDFILADYGFGDPTRYVAKIQNFADLSDL